MKMMVNSVETLQKKIAQVRAAQEQFAKFTQEQVDEIFFQVSMAANQARIQLAKMAVEETGIGVAEDKVIKITTHQNIYIMHIKMLKLAEL